MVRESEYFAEHTPASPERAPQTGRLPLRGGEFCYIGGVSERATGSAWLCDGRGRIVEVLRDDLNVSLGVGPGEPLSTIIAPSDAEVLAQFFDELRAADAVFGFTMHIIFADKLTPFHVAGAASDDYFTVMASLRPVAPESLERARSVEPKDELDADLRRLVERVEAIGDAELLAIARRLRARLS